MHIFKRLSIVLGTVGLLIAVGYSVMDHLDERLRRSIIVEMAERGRLRAEHDIAHGILRWPFPCDLHSMAAEWCRLYGVECIVLPYDALPGLGNCISSPTTYASIVESDVYKFFMAAHIRRLLGEEGLEHMSRLRAFMLEHPTGPSPTPSPNPGMQRTRYARR
jgi:hypothetical protein